MSNMDVYEWVKWVIDIIIDKYERSSNPDVIHVSEVAYCLRKAYFQRYHNIERDVKHKVRMFIGQTIHDVLEKFHPADCLTEQVVTKNLNDFTVIGHVDMIDADSIPYEFKYTHLRFRSIPKYYMLQVVGYTWLLDVNYGYLVIIFADGDVKIRKIYKSVDLLTEFLTRADKLHKYLVDRVLPPRERGVMCKACEYYHLCYGQNRLEVK